MSVFDCAFRPTKGARSISPMGHIKMMAATQPFLSGAISKTVNLPTECTVQDIEDAYIQAWRLGLKAIAVYRDGCKRTQPLSTNLKQATSTGRDNQSPLDAIASAAASVDPLSQLAPEERRLVEALRARKSRPSGPPMANRYKLPDERASFTHKFSIGGHEGYLTVGLYPDGSPGEIFVRMAKEGSVIAGLMDSFATAISLTLQYGVPLKVLIDKFSHVRFEPSGHTGNSEVPYAKSIVDYIFRWLASKFLPRDEAIHAGVHLPDAEPSAQSAESAASKPLTDLKSMYALDDAPTCAGCGSIMVRNGSCYKCMNCGETSGCS